MAEGEGLEERETSIFLLTSLAILKMLTKCDFYSGGAEKGCQTKTPDIMMTRRGRLSVPPLRGLLCINLINHEL